MIKNNQKTIFYISILFTILFITNLIYSIKNFTRLDPYSGLIMSISILFGLTSLVMTFIFKKRSDVLEKAIKKNIFLAKWDYTTKEWDSFLKEELRTRLLENRLYFIIITVISTLVFGIFILIINKERLSMFYAYLSLILLIFIISNMFPYLDNLFKKKQSKQILILAKGIFIAGHYHTWDFPLSKLRFVKIKTKPFNHLFINYNFFDRLGPRDYSLIIPIPNNESKDKVLEIVNKLKTVNKLKK
jgi:hypothetical protein